MENKNQMNENHLDNARALSIRDLLKFKSEDDIRADLRNHFDDEKYVEKLMKKAKALASSASERKTAFSAFENSEIDEESIIPYALTLLPLLSKKQEAIEYLKMLKKKHDEQFAKHVLDLASEYKKGQKVKEDNTVKQGTLDKIDQSSNTVTIKNQDGTQTVAPTTMLSKDASGKLMLNKPAISGSSNSIGINSLKPTVGSPVTMQDDIDLDYIKKAVR